MPIIETRGSLSSRGYGQFAQGGAAPVAGAFIEDVFSTTLYGGTGAAQSIANGIALGTGATSAGWFANIFSSTDNEARGVAVDSTGNAYVCGNTNTGANSIPTLAKLSPTGALLWQTSLPPTVAGQAPSFYAVAVDSSGDVYVCGDCVITVSTQTYRGILVAKYNSAGVLQWQRNYNSGASTGQNAQGRAITVDASGFIYIVGTSNFQNAIMTLKLNSTGVVQWQKRLIGDSLSTRGSGVAVDGSGNVYAVGDSTYTSGEDNYERVLIAKYDASGSLLWQRYIGSVPEYGLGAACSLDSSGNLYVSYTSQGISSFVLAKYNPSGTLQWQQTRTNAASAGTKVVTSASGDSYACARLEGSFNSAIIVKYNTSGVLQWQREIKTAFLNDLFGIALNGSDSLWVAGVGSGSGYPNRYPAIVARLPTDGSGVGAYFLNGLNYQYLVSAAGSGGSATSTGGGSTDAAGTFVTTTTTFTNTPTFLATALTPLAQGTGLGGLVWIKGRSGGTDHALYDTTRGATAELASNLTNAQTTQAQGLTAFLGSGFSIGSLAKLNTSAAIYAAWTFAEQSKFFDVVTYTGDGVAGRTVAHNLGSVPGCIIIKRTNGVGAWGVYHRAAANDGLSGATVQLLLNTTDAAFATSTYWNNTPPTSTVFTLGTNITVNQSGQPYIAYLFAHDAGGFGASGTDNVISCGSYTGNGSATGPIVTLGWEPQFLIIKRANGGIDNWNLIDNMRGFVVGGTDAGLNPNLANAESTGTFVSPTATGFQLNTTGSAYNASGSNYIYIAIRRGPMRTPTLGTNVFMPTVYTGTNVNNRLVNTSIAPDTVWMRQRNDAVLQGMVVGDRLRGQPYWLTDNAAGEVTSATAFDQQLVGGTEYGSAFAAMNGVWVGTDATAKLNVNTTANNHIAEAFRRAPGFHDVVCYTGTGSGGREVNHNLGVVPEFIIIKNRSATAAPQTLFTLGPGYEGRLSADSALTTPPPSTLWGQAGSYIPPTSTVFTLGNDAGVNASTNNYVAYLFASCPGVSKVGTYTGTGSTVQVDCGFTAGARFVLIKRRDGVGGNWFVWDSARGIVAGNDPYLTLNQNAAEVTTTDWVDTLATGFEISNAAGNEVNTAGGAYLFLAIA